VKRKHKGALLCYFGILSFFAIATHGNFRMVLEAAAMIPTALLAYRGWCMWVDGMYDK